MCPQCPPCLQGWTPLHRAANEGHNTIVERLLAASADEDAVDKQGLGLGAERVNPDSAQICRNLLQCEFTFLENLHQLARQDTLSVGRQKRSRDGVGLVKTCALAFQREGCSVYSFGEGFLEL